MTPKQAEQIKHALGMDYRPWRSGRRYYCADASEADMEALVAEGLMERGRAINEGKHRYYFVTEAGRKAVGDTRKLNGDGNPTGRPIRPAHERHSWDKQAGKCSTCGCAWGKRAGVACTGSKESEA